MLQKISIKIPSNRVKRHRLHFFQFVLGAIGIYGLKIRQRNTGLENWFDSIFAAQKHCVNAFLPLDVQINLWQMYAPL